MTPRTALSPQLKAWPAQIKARKDGLIEATISTGTMDRDGDIVEPSGWDLTNFRKNPVIQWAHDYDLPPIGRAVDIGVRGKALGATIEFAPTDRARECATLVRTGFLKGVSAGFIPLEAEPIEGAGHRFKRQELIEASLVPVPSNPDGLVTASMVKSFRSRAVRLRSLGRHSGSGSLPSVRDLDTRFATKATARYVAGLAERGYLRSEVKRMGAVFALALVEYLAAGIDHTEAVTRAAVRAEKEAVA